MKTVFLTTAAVLTLASVSAQAADLAYRKAPPPAAIVAQNYDWSGFYIGVEGGFGFGRLDWTYNGLGTTANHNTAGGLIGGTIGYNWQAGSMVFGLEADGAWASITGATACPAGGFNCRSTINTVSTWRARLGQSWGPVMAYITGGAIGVEQNLRTVSPAGVVAGSNNYGIGWTAGGGFEYMFAQNWSLKGEALYFDTGRRNYDVDSGLTVNARQNGVIARGGINYHFNWGSAPVVARY
jgi:outer membrane immunogenic protein